MKSRLPRFRLGTLLVCVTLLCLWLGYQMRWVHQRRDALAWIESHQPDDIHRFNEPYFGGGRLIKPSWIRFEPAQAPWILRLLGEPRVWSFIVLDRTKIAEPEEETLDRLQRFFPEAEGVCFVSAPTRRPEPTPSSEEP